MASSITPDVCNVVVTGGSGFIGRALVAAFRQRGARVTVVDRQPGTVEDEGVTHIQGDLADPAIRERAILPGTDGIVHLAAITSVLKSREMPAKTYSENVAITHELLELARMHGVPKFILASTNAVVGDVGTSTITEDLALAPLTPYGATKAACEMLMSGYAGAYGMTTCALRFTNVYGPGMSHKDSFVPRLMRAALTESGVKVYGTGEQRRDLVFLDDVVRGILLAFDSGHVGRAIVGAGRSVSVLDLIETVREVTGCPIPVEHVPAPGGEMPAVVVDISRSADTIGYTPAYDLKAGLAATWQYFLDHDRQKVR
ncbi:UDP-glucose 4-epimerase [Prauserella sp. PE36]|uniref:NAD(P)-dependent oxidoreductase n=1 Tax=Prauserella endophytica TaxID=1592324 RepID=A0ABY2S300_9PSEU|nr:MULTISPECIES: NAD(P)-dependent oxidoreductase [Prauserella]PXY37057.1 UDP-glucose 4-epimerase [Prauserella coralliicola]RBM10275.1 UDP-glucose 4-epimerase [Prauserella sp. PE36]TKG68413.1 NAD(P)-dependent oxidoreductase [Prauserella endophytica]